MIDGININDSNVYVSGDPSKWADDTAANYVAVGQVPSGGGYQRDLMTGAALLPSSMTGASATTFIGDSLWTDLSWRGALAGGDAYRSSEGGAFGVYLSSLSSDKSTGNSGRLAYAA